MLAATGPNEVYSWDITKLHGPAKWTYYHLYVILDVSSRYAVGWMVATRESAALAEKLIAATCAKQGITRGQLSLHADRGSSMTSKPVALLLADLGVTESTPARTYPTTTRTPRRSSDPEVPAGVPARLPRSKPPVRTAQEFFRWYNNEQPPRRTRPAHSPPTSTTATPRPSGQPAPRSWTPPTSPTERFVTKPPAPPKLPGTSWIKPTGRRRRHSRSPQTAPRTG